MKPFDEQFADQVREVFDKYEEPYNAAAWEALESRMQGSGSRGLLAFVIRRPWFGTAAAILVLAASLLLWQGLFEGSPMQQTDLAQDQRGPAPATPPSSTIEPSSTVAPSSTPLQSVAVTPSASSALADLPARQEMTPGHVPADAPQTVSENPAYAVVTREAEQADTKATEEMFSTTSPYGMPVMPAVPTSIPYEQEHTRSVAVASAAPVLSWDISAGPMITYVEQQMAGGIGFAGGLTGKWRVADRLALAGGMMLAYQQFSVSGMPLSIQYSGDAMKPDNITAEVVADHEYELLSLDFPLNMRWKISKNRRHALYVSAGFSSLLFLQQNVTGQTIAYLKEVYNSPGLGSSIERQYTSTADISASYQAFARFDFARLLNLSFGYTLNRDKNTMVIEPFLKLPLGRISSRELHMGMGGVVLRYQFGTPD